MLTYIVLAFVGLVVLTFFVRPNPNQNVKNYRFKLAMQRNILALANFAMLPLTIFLGHLFFGIMTDGFNAATINAAVAAMYSLWYIYAICIVLAVLMSFKMTESIGNQIGKMKNGSNGLFKGATLAPANLQQDVVDMCGYLGIKNVPNLFVLPADGPPNAFAIGVHNGHSAVAIHGSLVRELTTDELRAVIAHELGHIAAGDMHMKILGMLVDSTRFFLLISLLFTLEGGFITELVAVWGAYTIVKTVDTMLDLAMSRRAEFNADAVAVEIQGSGVPMSNALLKLEALLLSEAPVLLERSQRTSRWLKTHPPTTERVNAARRLRTK